MASLAMIFISLAIITPPNLAIRVTTSRPSSNHTNHTTKAPTPMPTSKPTMSQGCLPNLKPTTRQDIVFPNAKFTAPFSVSYSNKSNLVFMAGEFGQWIGNTSKTTRKSFIVSYDPATWANISTVTWDTQIRTPKLPEMSLRPTTNVFAEPNGDGVYGFGIRTLVKYNSTLKQQWVAKVAGCPTAKTNDVKYSDAAVNVMDPGVIWLIGTCHISAKLVLDGYSTKDGSLVHRQTFDIKHVFFHDLAVASVFINIGLIAPDVSLAATKDGGFYVAVSHMIFNGYCFLERIGGTSTTKSPLPVNADVFEWAFNTSIITASVLNPSLSARRQIVVDDMDRGIMTVEHMTFIETFLPAPLGGRHYLARWDKTGSAFPQRDLWTNGHPQIGDALGHDFDLFLEWTLAGDVEKKNLYAVSAGVPSIVDITGQSPKSTIAKYSTSGVKLEAGLEFIGFAASAAVTRDEQVIVVGMNLHLNCPRTTGQMEGDDGLKLSIHPCRVGFMQVVDGANVTMKTPCEYCQPAWYGSGSAPCAGKCNCKYGGCLDGVKGDGSCLCNIISYNGSAGCLPCKCKMTDGLCDSGRHGSGLCKICFGNQTIGPLKQLSVNRKHDLDALKIKLKWPDKYGPMCQQDCKCKAADGLCDPRGNSRGECLLCKSQGLYGEFCNNSCACDEYSSCSRGVRGNGSCVALDEGKSLSGVKVPGGIYAGVIIAMFAVMLGATWWNAKRKSLHGYLPLLPEGMSGMDRELLT